MYPRSLVQPSKVSVLTQQMAGLNSELLLLIVDCLYDYKQVNTFKTVNLTGKLATLANSSDRWLV